MAAKKKSTGTTKSASAAKSSSAAKPASPAKAAAKSATETKSSAPSSIKDFVDQCGPCAEAVDRIEKPQDGLGPVTDMAEAWRRARNGLWLEWVVKRFAPTEAKALHLVRARRLGPVLRKANRPEHAAVWDAALRAYADDIRRFVKNPFDPSG